MRYLLMVAGLLIMQSSYADMMNYFSCRTTDNLAIKVDWLGKGDNWRLRYGPPNKIKTLANNGTESSDSIRGYENLEQRFLFQSGNYTYHIYIEWDRSDEVPEPMNAGLFKKQNGRVIERKLCKPNTIFLGNG